MKVTWFFLLFAFLFIPLSAQAKVSCCGGPGLIYNSEEGRFYPVPTQEGCTIYRSVDGKLYPVAKYGYSCHRIKHSFSTCPRYACSKRFVSVYCETRPGYWWSGHWFPDSKVCWYRR